jgi:hypothetical protein
VKIDYKLKVSTSAVRLKNKTLFFFTFEWQEAVGKNNTKTLA